MYLLQELSIICAGSLWVCVDTINFGLLTLHKVMLRTLGERLVKLGWTPATNSKNYKELCALIQYHVNISRLVLTNSSVSTFDLCLKNGQIALQISERDQ